MTASPAPLLIRDARVVSPDGVHERGWLAARDGRIDALGAGTPPAAQTEGARIVDAAGDLLLPGFIDVHAHGAVGHEAMDADADGLREMARFYARHGVTAFLPTTWTASERDTAAALETIAAVCGPVDGGASILGAHMEGPYLHPAKCGAQDPALIRPAERREATRLLDTGVVRLITLAPDVPENGWLIDACASRGITVSAGHTEAGWSAMRAAAGRGVSHVTHTYNAMTPLRHREPGTVGAALALDAFACEVIADTVHVHPAALRILHRTKPRDRVILVTDAVRGTGLAEDSFDLGGRRVALVDGAARLPDGTIAGSVLTLDAALANFARATGAPPESLWEAVSLNAARSAGIDTVKGSLEVGKDADLVLLDVELEVRMTVACGHIVHERPHAGWVK